MDREIQRKFSLEILSEKNLTINLYDYSQYISDPEDITKICAFFEEYHEKYFIDVFDINIDSATISKSSPLISEIVVFIRDLNDVQFEKFSAIICKCLGYNNFYATKKSYDHGIDFIAYAEYPFLNIDYRQHILGQCKHFNSILVDVKDIRELAGSVILFSRKEFATTEDSYARFILGSFAPINVFFISNYFFSNAADSLCSKTNIVPLDIIDVTCLCYKGISKKVLNWLDNNDKLNSKKIFAELNNVEIVR